MPIIWNCSCGKSLRVADHLAGRRVKCPACDGAVTVPQADTGFEVIEDTDAMPSPLPKPAAKHVRAVVSKDEEQRKRRQLDENDEDEPPRNKKRTDEDDDEEDERPRKKKQSDEQDEEERPRNKKRTDDDDNEDDEDERPRKKKKGLKKGKTVNKNFHMEHGILNAGVLGGLAAMVGAVIWFVVGLFNDIIFFYPPVLFVLGLIAMVKGALNRNED